MTWGAEFEKRPKLKTFSPIQNSKNTNGLMMNCDWAPLNTAWNVVLILETNWRMSGLPNVIHY